MNSARTSLPITYREYRFTPDFPLLLMEVTAATAQADFIHFHNCIEIAVCEQGMMNWNLENDICQMNPGSFCLLPPFFTHASFFPPQEGDMLCHYLFFNPEQLLKPFYPSGLPEEFQWYHYTSFDKVMDGAEYAEEIRLLRRILQELRTQGPHYRQIICGLTEALLTLLYRHHQKNPMFMPSSNSIPQLFPAISFLDKEYIQEPDIPHLAHLCGLSRKQFLEKFRQSFHQTPLQYLKTLRVRKACYLLTSTEICILDIALQTGFQSLSGFNRSFQNVMGRSAQAFRNEKRAIVKKNPRHAPFAAHPVT